MNALADLAAGRRCASDHEILEGVDAFDVAAIEARETVAVVGTFVPFLRPLRSLGARHWVLKKDPATLKPHEMPFYRPAEQANELVPQADVLQVTGTTLVNDILDGLLALVRPTARVVVGPTGSLIPDVFLRRGCHIVGSVRITNPDLPRRPGRERLRLSFPRSLRPQGGPASARSHSAGRDPGVRRGSSGAAPRPGSLDREPRTRTALPRTPVPRYRQAYGAHGVASRLAWARAAAPTS